MRKRKNPCCLCVATILAIILALHPLVGLAFEDTAVTQPVSYSFISIDIPHPSGDLGFTILTDINNDGEITGYFSRSSGLGFLLGETFRLTDIQCPGAILGTQPVSINKRGEIAGFCDISGGPDGFFRSKEGKYTLLNFPGANLTQAFGINDDGEVVGDYRDSSGKFHGFFWDAGLFFTIDVPFPEAISTAPRAINNVGQIVGFYDDNMGGLRGFLDNRGSFISFDFPGSRVTVPTDINDDGQIVGLYVPDLAMDVRQSFLLKNGRFTTINVPFPDVVSTEVSGINNRGQIVGTYVKNNPGDLVNPLSFHGFIATPQSEPESKSPLVGSEPNDSSSFKRWTQNGEELDHQFGKWRRRLP